MLRIVAVSTHWLLHWKIKTKVNQLLKQAKDNEIESWEKWESQKVY